MERSSLSARGARISQETLADGYLNHFKALKDLYDPVKNPHGYINMGASETTLVDAEIISLIGKVQARTPLTRAGLHYVPDHGSDDFRGEIAARWQGIIFNAHSERHLSGDNVVVSTGVTVALDMLAHLLGDPGDVILVHAPCYASFEFDFAHRADVALAPVHSGPELDVSCFERALADQQAQGKRVRGVLLSSPNNPVGTVYTRAQLSGLVEFCIANDLEIVSDEIYCQTVFDPDSSWCSMLDVVPDQYLNHAHVLGGFAKDFTLSGFKVGFALSFNDTLLAGLRNLAYFSPVSTYTQFILTGLLRAPELDEFMKLNRTRLGEACAEAKAGLDALGIASRPAHAGMFLMADFSRYLKEPTFERELELAGRLHNDLKVNFVPGLAYKEKTPGWLRLCYPQGKETLQELFRRLKTLNPA